MAQRLSFVLASALGLFLVFGAGLGSKGRGTRESADISREPDGKGLLSPTNERTPYDPGLVGKTVAFWEEQAAPRPARNP